MRLLCVQGLEKGLGSAGMKEMAVFVFVFQDRLREVQDLMQEFSRMVRCGIFEKARTR